MEGATPVAFLQEIFGLNRGVPLSGFIRFALVDTSTREDKWGAQTPIWKSAEALASADPNTPLHEFLGRSHEGLNVYFTPHMFQKIPAGGGLSVNKEDVVLFGAASWVECDDTDISPSHFNPPPSLVVETSPGRHHLYWLLEQPLELKEIEKLNWRLTYGSGLRKDTGGWHLVKFLRVPGTKSYKRTPPSPVQITSEGWNPSRLYSLESFDTLEAFPEGDEYDNFLEGFKLLEAPKGDPHEGGLDYYKERYHLSQEMITLLTERANDRSNALWRLYNGGLRDNIPAEDLFFMILGSPNDKFSSEWRYNARQGLWTDIIRAVRMQERVGQSPARNRILAIMSAKGVSIAQKRQQVADTVYQDLSTLGRLYFDEEMGEALYLNKSVHENGLPTSDSLRVVPIEPTSPQWRILFTNRYGIPKGAPDYGIINELVFTQCGHTGERVKPHHFAHFDPKTKMLYIHAGSRYMYRLDGETITRLDNGDDEVIFRVKPGATPFEADLSIAQGGVAYRELPSSKRSAPTLEEALFTIPNFTPADRGGASPEDQANLARLWLYCLFFPELMPARPHLVVTGPTSSGKTMFFELMLDLFYGPGQRVMSIPTDKKEFETAVTNHHMVIYDNVDTPNAWFTDAVAEVATGIQYSKRILYTTNTSVQYNAQCFLGMTTRDPWFSRTDVATRLIVLNVDRRAETYTPLALINKIIDFRGHLWGQLLWDLNRIVRYLRLEGGMATFEDTRSSIRMAGFEAMAHAVAGRVVPLNPKSLVGSVTETQSQAALDHSILWDLLRRWLNRTDFGDYPHLNRQVSAAEIHAALRDIANLNGMGIRYERSVGSTRSLGKQLKELIPEISKRYDVEVINHPHGARYVFNHIDGVVYEPYDD